MHQPPADLAAERRAERLPPRVSSPGRWVQMRVVRDLVWNVYDIALPDLPDALVGLRIVHLSDFHLRDWIDPAIATLHQRLREHPPDLLLFSGDFIHDKLDASPALPALRAMLSGLRARFAVVSILGNHDCALDATILDELGIERIDARQRVVAINDAAIELIGLPGLDKIEITPELIGSFPPVQPGRPRLVVGHYPDVLRRLGSLTPAIYFAGHTHGGQICLPGGVPIIRHDDLPRRLCAGVHRVGSTWLVVNRGWGYSGLRLRTFCPSEVIEVRLTRA